jgi:hypothetical protein
VIDRETLIRRAAALAGAVYVAPVLTSAASAAGPGCSGQPCKGNRKCKRVGGKACACVDGRCSTRCAQDRRCPPPGGPCDVIVPCAGEDTCVCFAVAPAARENECVDFPSGFCADYPPCDKVTGEGCQPGMCCLETCCPGGICSPPCRS